MTASTSPIAWTARAPGWTSGDCRVADRRAAPILDTVYAEGFATTLARRKVGRLPVRPVRPQRGLRPSLRRAQQRHQAALDGVQGRRTAALALRQRRTVLHDDRWPHHERVAFIWRADGGIEAGPPEMLFQTRPVPKTWNLYDVSPDGQRFLSTSRWSGPAPRRSRSSPTGPKSSKSNNNIFIFSSLRVTQSMPERCYNIECSPCTESRKNMSKRKFWPLDFDLEGEIYENPAWDLPGFRRPRTRAPFAARGLTSQRNVGRRSRSLRAGVVGPNTCRNRTLT